MEISEEKAKELLEHPNNLLNNVHFVKLHNGSRNGGKAVPSIIRELVGVAAHHDTIKEVAKEFGVSESTVAQAKKGNVGVNRHDPDLRERIDDQVENEKRSVRDLALDRISTMFATVITEENLASIDKPREAVAVAKDLAAIADRTTAKQATNQTAVFIHMTREKSEAEYGDVIVLDHVPDVKRKE